MDNLNVRIEDMLGYIDTHGVEGFDDSKVEELEAILHGCNELMKDLYADPVADSIYDHLYAVLKQVKPSSGIFNEIWEDDGDITDYTDLLVKNPMMSIETAKSYECSELTNFIKRIPEDEDYGYFASYKINGHGIRVVYKNGILVSATSRGRSSASRDLTQHLKWILGERCNSLAEYGLIELRGELCLRTDKLEEVREKFNSTVKSAFSAVSSLIKPSATEEEASMLDFLCYGFICDGYEFPTREDEFQKIQECGFNVPDFCLIESCSKAGLLDMIKALVNRFEENYEEFGYFCDGVVFEVNDRKLFKELGTEGNHNLGNVALKVGVWEQVSYSGIINMILWKRGKSKLSPVAIVSENGNDLVVDENGKPSNLDSIGVLTSQGNRVKRVPLYEPKNILVLDAYVGRPLSFRYGGEAGVVPCFPDGRLLKEDVVKEVLTGEDNFPDSGKDFVDTGDSWGDLQKMF